MSIRFFARITLVSSCFFFCLCIVLTARTATIAFASGDGIEITADLYMPHPAQAPFIVLFHQAGWSRGEYNEIAPKLNRLGYNCMAVDQRSGEHINGVDNETFTRARKAGTSTELLDAYADMQAAVQYVHTQCAPQQLIVWGSSYSAALALVLAAEYKERINGVLSFSPGEYFARFGKSSTFVRDAVSSLAIAVFITSAAKEQGQWQGIFTAIPSAQKVSFLPTTAGNHGSRALWNRFDDNDVYWQAVTNFLTQYFPAARK